MSLRIIILSLMIGLGLSALAKGDYTDPYKGYDEVAFMELDLESNLSLPEVSESCHQAITQYINRIATDLAKRKYTVDLLRDDEVILITIPTDDLFFPNDTLLSSSAPAKLQPVIDLLSLPYMYKVVYGVHTDNTGSPFYNMELSHKRNSSIYDYLLDHVSDDQIVIPYEYGDTDPIEPNNTRQGRRDNRRLELYLVPGPKMIEMAHKKTLH
ncbi:MAG: OmpA family protein [Lachnoclostridium sp.]|nr:OmpA family protein [Lachnoclostridium sp.]